MVGFYDGTRRAARYWRYAAEGKGFGEKKEGVKG